jgi:hypothetical protein
MHYKKNHGLFDGKITLRTNHFGIWSIWPLGHTKQVNLNIFKFISVFFIDHKMVYLIGQIGK